MNDILEKVEAFARDSHGDQRRKYRDEAYVNHPIRVMGICRQYNQTLPVAAAALLHDVLEDTTVSSEEMLDFLDHVMAPGDARHTMMLVKDLTDIYTHAAYPQWNRRARKAKESERLGKSHPDAQTIKYADIIDNSNDIVGSGDDFGPTFLHECEAVLKKMKSGNPELYKLALETVHSVLQSLPEH